jgi:hypothetical protein
MDRGAGMKRAMAETRMFFHVSVFCLCTTFALSSLHPLAAQDAVNSVPAKGEDAHCSIRLQTFLTELDRTLDSKPASIDPVLRLFKDHFPLEGCDIETALQICRGSRYFVHISESPHVYVVLFDTNKYSKHSGIQVQFGVSKASGSSSLPFAKVKF